MRSISRERRPMALPDRLRREIEEAAGAVRRGGVIGYPTETVYGLGCDARNADAVGRIYAMKGRGSESPMLILIRDASRLSAFVGEVPAPARMLMDRFWPGPLTLVLPAAPGFDSRILGEGGSLAVRISSDPVCVELLRRWDGPLVSTSANRTGQPAAATAAELRAIFRENLDAVVDGGSRASGMPSTIVDARMHPPRVLREGAVAGASIADALGGSDG